MSWFSVSKRSFLEVQPHQSLVHAGLSFRWNRFCTGAGFASPQKNHINELLTMMFKKTLLLILLPFVASTRFKFNNDATCSDSASVSIDTFACDGENVCSMGTKLETSGSITFNSDVPESSCVSVKACLYGASFLCRSYSLEEVNLCNELQLTSEDGTECPTAGTYSFSNSLNIPNFNFNLGSGWSVTAFVDVVDCDSQETFTSCSGSFNAITSSNTNTTASFVNYSAVGVVALGAAVALFERQRRRTARIDLNREELLASSHVEMAPGVHV